MFGLQWSLIKWLGIGLAVALLFAHDRRVDHLRGEHLAALKESRAAMKAQEEAYSAAQALAEAKALQQKAAFEDKYQAIARRADNAQKQLEMRGAADRYARAHRVPADLAGSCSRADPATDDHPSKGGDGPGDDARVAISRNDFDIFVANSIRLSQIHDWGQALIKEKLAIPEPEFGK